MAENEVRPDEAYALGEGTSLKVLFRDVWTHLGLVLSIWIAVVVVVLFATLTTRPEYESKVRLLLESSEPQVVDVKKVVEQSYETSTYLKTQVKLIKSKQVARRVISTLNLREHKEFQRLDPGVFWDWYQNGYRELKGAVQSWVRGIFNSSNSSPSIDSTNKSSPLENQLLSRLRVNPIRGTRLLDISFRGYYPKAVAAIANAVADQFIEWNLELEFSGTRRAAKWLEGQLAELKKVVEQSERALQAYRQAENLMGVEVAESPDIITGALGTLSSEIMKARSERIAAEASYREFKNYFGKNGTSTKLGDIPVGLLGGDTLITNLQNDLAESEREYANLSKRYKPKHPVLVQLRSKTDFLKSRLRREISQAIKKLETRFVVAQKRERSLSQSLEQEKARVIRLGGKTLKLGILKREVESNRKLYGLFLGRIKETNLATNLQVTNIQIVDRAIVPEDPIRPRKGRNLLLAAILGLFLGVGAAFGVENLDTSLRDPEETEGALGVPIMATIDRFGKFDKRGGELVARNKKRSELAGSFDTLRTNLLYSVPAEDRQVLMVTSAAPREGKTFVVSNLGATLASLGEDVLLVDADLRRPRLHGVFGVSREPGLTDLLVGRSALEDVLHDVGVDHLRVLPAGHSSASPIDLLSSHRVHGVFRELQSRFQYIVVDSPPVLSVPDALALVPRMNGILVVLWAGQTPRRHVMQGVRRLKAIQEDDGRRFFGLVMNRISRGRGTSYYYYHQRYGYQYSEEK